MALPETAARPWNGSIFTQPREHGHLKGETLQSRLSLDLSRHVHQPGVPHYGAAMDQTRPNDATGNRLKPEACHTIDLGLEGFCECAQVGPNACKYALPFGYAFLCSHPEFQARQRPRQPAPRTSDTAVHRP